METMTAAESTGATVPLGRNPTFQRLLRASSVSMLGSHVTTIAYPLLVLRLTGSPVVAGWVAFAATAPSILVHIPAGALVDRWDPRWTMLLSELGRGVIIAAVAITVALGKPSVPLLMTAAVIEGVLKVFSVLGERRYVGSLVGRDQASSALVRIEARTHVVLLAGRPLGGLLFGIRPILPFLADVASFVYSVMTLIKIRSVRPAKESADARCEAAPRGNLRRDIRDGLRWLHEDHFVRVTIILFAIGTLIFQALIMVFLADAHAQQLSALTIGMVLAASGIGGALGSVAASRLLARVTYSWIMIQALVWFLGFAVLAWSAGRQFLLMAAVMAALGFTGALGNIELDTRIMQNTERDMLARATSISRLMSFSACAIGPALGGFLVQEFGVQRGMYFLFFSTLALLPLSAVAHSASSPRSHAVDKPEETLTDRPIPVAQP
jgi:predicted MFS family arabinose efflux permease